MTNKYDNKSMLEIAEELMLRKKTPQSFRKIAQEVSEIMGLSAEELKKRLTRFYADLTLSGKFVNVSGDKWDLKSRQKFEVYENQFVYDDEEEEEDYDYDEEDLDGEELEEDDEEDLDDEELPEYDDFETDDVEDL